ncbi:dGTP triphosphohydrolase [Bacteroidia bacterium]|nr:dGTP triphosphohydrolase [Bacteroidia bacterium]
MMEKQKKFLDTVHGYITIPETYCDKIIDTIEFQRLRRIEQTSSRSIFPCARHDRFIHSLGVYHIGNKIFKQIKKRCEVNEILTKPEWNTIEKTYQIACLLHDCGHAPFSHTFEKYYDKPPKLTDKLVELANDEDFTKVVVDQSESAQHERLSAILLLEHFKDIIFDLEGDPLLAVRMIIGCKYNLQENYSAYKAISNCFISLLNGEIIDADKIDYVCRDKWASGYSATNVDVERLISSIHLKNKNNREYYICFDKNALHEIQSVLDVKNFQYLYVISHHKVVYDQYILDKAIESLAELIFPNDRKEMALSKLFDYKSFLERVEIGNYFLYLPSDDDLIHLLKHYINDNKFAKEWFSRQHSFFPLWKSRSEFLHYFKGISITKLKDEHNKGRLEPQLTRFFEKKNIKHLYLDATPKFSKIDESQVKIDINGDICSYTDLDLPSSSIEKNFLFYIYISQDDAGQQFSITELKQVLENITS